jgi:hypothetical protein
VHGKTAYTWSTEYQKWVITSQGPSWELLKGVVAWFAGWENAALWDAHWVLTEYDEVHLAALGCEVIEQ